LGGTSEWLDKEQLAKKSMGMRRARSDLKNRSTKKRLIRKTYINIYRLNLSYQNREIFPPVAGGQS
jgi:hypothetical protein